MSFRHIFKAKLNWIFSTKKEQSISTSYNRSHTITIDGKEILYLSAAKAFKGNPTLYNPEDLLLSSVVSCHLMSYLHVCKQNGIEIISYSDEAEATMEVFDDGSGRFTGIKLYPKFTITNKDKMQLALELHKKANELCFIANSCNFPIEHFPMGEIATEN